MGQLILSLGEKKIAVPKELQGLKENGFMSAQYSFVDIKQMIARISLSSNLKLKHAGNTKKT